MKRLHIWLAIGVICLSVFCIGRNADASVVWGKDANGIYVNNKGEAIERAVKKGIDVSYAQGSIDWEQVKESDVEFVMIRTGSGGNLTENDDSKWEYNSSECERLGIPYGAYHYAKATTVAEAKEEAAHVIRLLAGKNLSYPVYYDMESNSIANLTASQYAANAKAFCDEIEAAGYKTGIYANKTWFDTKLTDPWFDSQEKWIARWNSYCGYEGSYRMWQCTSEGTVNGIPGSVDINFLIEDAPAKVSFTKAVSAGYNSHTLTWRAIEGVDGYEIWCKGPNASTYTLLKKVSPNTCTIGKRNTGKYYSYQIRAYKKINGTTEYGEYSAVKKAKAVPAKTILKSVKRANKKKVTIKWTKVAGANGYQIYYSTKKGSGYKLLTTVKKGTTTSVKVNVAKGKRFYYKIRAYRNVSKKPVYGGYSEILSCK